VIVFFSKLKGEQGSVVLTIYRKSADKKIKIKIKRGYSIKSVDVAVLLNDSTGYIKSIVLKPLLKNLKWTC
jgi:carboxyl-terminal processing protease